MEAILLFNSNWKQYESAELFSPDLMIGFWPEKRRLVDNLGCSSGTYDACAILVEHNVKTFGLACRPGLRPVQDV